MYNALRGETTQSSESGHVCFTIVCYWRKSAKDS